MDPGAFVREIGGGVAGLVGGAIGAIGDGISTLISAGQEALPGPLFPIVVLGTIGAFLFWLLRK
jgi:hypothetical protein